MSCGRPAAGARSRATRRMCGLGVTACVAPDRGTFETWENVAGHADADPAHRLARN